ncbi:alpha-amylase A type-1/2 [Aspergillus udagawae]|uniref:alpha-amylase n=1 Tax=Aspergillus udagawae TaxID=91492 RepID=A0A8E0V5B9_9EURO|nr:alpha-amylase A type-1/2 [Aspergillus udagawae]GIC94705.1 alpha-amylase A type-1/2 [Aspergillus udagawae]
MGFTAIWITPIVEQIPQTTTEGTGFHGYWPQNIYSVNSHFGTADDIRALSKALHDRGMYLMLDVVANHMGFNGPGASTDFIDGLRIDTAKHVEKDFWSGYTQAAGVYSVGEILHGDPAYTCGYQVYMDGVMNYPIYYQLVNAFKSSSGSISSLSNMISSVASNCKDPTLLGNFIENHDNPRFPSYTSDISQAKSVIAYIFLTDGIPIIYSGQEQHLSGGADPYNLIATTNKIRRLAISKDLNYLPARNNPFYTDSNTIAMKKGSRGSNVITVLTNSGSNAGSYTLNLNSHGYSSGSRLIELYTCSSVQVDSNGNLPVPMSSGLPRVLVPSAWVLGRGLCGASSTTSLATPTVTSTSAGTCAPSTAIPIIFKERVATSYGENIFLSGPIDQLGNWDTSKAVALSASGYTSSNPVWSVKLGLRTGTYFQYKFIKKGQDGSVTWESDPNRSYTLPSGCVETAISIADSWR